MPGYQADFAVFDNLQDLHVEMTVIKGHVWYHDGQLEDVPVPEVDAWLSDKAHHTFNLDRLRRIVLRIIGRGASSAWCREKL